jgi:hypothetical protein
MPEPDPAPVAPAPVPDPTPEPQPAAAPPADAPAAPDPAATAELILTPKVPLDWREPKRTLPEPQPWERHHRYHPMRLNKPESDA